LANFDRASQVAREAGLAKEEADWHKGKGTTLAGLGRYDTALHEYAAAEQVYERSGLQRELIEALNDTGSLYELLGDGNAADMRFQRALRLAQKIRNAAGESSSLLALGELERRRKRNDAADTYFGRALDRARFAGDEGTIVSALLQRASSEMDRKRYDSALQHALEARELTERSGNRPAMAQSRYVLGEVRRSRTEFQQAIEEYSAAEGLQQQLRDPELGWRVLYGRGQTLEAMGKAADAISAYENAIRIIEETRSGISQERYRAGYMEDRIIIGERIKAGVIAERSFTPQRLGRIDVAFDDNI